VSERFDDFEEDRNVTSESGSDPDPTYRPIPLDPGDALDTSRGIVGTELVEFNAEVGKDGGKVGFKGAPDVLTQVLGVGSVVAGGILWPTAGWESGVMVAILGPTIAWLFRRR
jgi:hypothetical protein